MPKTRSKRHAGSRESGRRRSKRYKMSKGQKERFLSEIIAEVGPPKKRIKDLSFNYSDHDNLYATLETEAFTKFGDSVEPISGSSLKPDGVAIFRIVTGPDEFIKLRDLPLQIGYRLEDPQTAQPTGTDKQKRDFLTVNKDDHMDYCLNAVPGISGLLHRAEIIINGTVISDSVGMGSHSDIYKALNQKVATDANRIRDQTFLYMKNGDQRYPPVKASTVTINQPAATGSVSADGTGAGTGVANTTATTATIPAVPASQQVAEGQRLINLPDYKSDSDLLYENFGFDGYPLLALPRNNALANLDLEKTGRDKNKMK